MKCLIIISVFILVAVIKAEDVSPSFEYISMDFSCQHVLKDMKEILKQSNSEQEQLLFKILYNVWMIVKDEVKGRFDALDQRTQELVDVVSLMQNETAMTTPATPDESKIVITRQKRETGKYLGCFQDNRLNRILYGFVAELSDNSVQYCISMCREKGFVYAGLENGDWCHCGNSLRNDIHQLSNFKCSTRCSGNRYQTCGGDLLMDIYKTGIEEYRFDKDGNRIGESQTETSEIVLRADCVAGRIKPDSNQNTASDDDDE